MAINSKAKVKFGGSCVLDRPKMATLIGAICAEWSFTEQMLSLIYSAMVTGQTAPDNLAAVESFESLESFRVKINLLLVAVDNRIKNKGLNASFKRAIREIQSLSTERNNIVHGRWGVSDMHKTGLIWVKRTTENINVNAKLVRESDLRRFLESIIKARSSAMAIYAVLISRMLESPANFGGDGKAS